MVVFEWLWLIILIIVDGLWGLESVIDIVKTIRFVLDEKHRKFHIPDFFRYGECYTIVWFIVNTTMLFMASLVCWALQH